MQFRIISFRGLHTKIQHLIGEICSKSSSTILSYLQVPGRHWHRHKCTWNRGNLALFNSVSSQAHFLGYVDLVVLQTPCVFSLTFYTGKVYAKLGSFSGICGPSPPNPMCLLFDLLCGESLCQIHPTAQPQCLQNAWKHDKVDRCCCRCSPQK